MSVSAPKLQIAIDSFPASAELGGVTKYTRELLKAYKTGISTDEVKISQLRGPYSIEFGPKKSLGDRLRVLARDLWWYPFGISFAAEKAGYNLLHMTTINGPVIARQPTIMTIHDLSVLHFPDQFPMWFRNYARFVLPYSATRSVHIITDAEFTKDDIHDTLNVPLDDITVIPLGVDRARFRVREPSTANETVRRQFGIEAPFFLHVGTLSPRKNLDRVIKALSIVRNNLQVPFELLVVGAPGWGMKEMSRDLTSLGLQDAVHFLGSVPEEDLPSLYSEATALVYVSLYEGFGLPILEAMSCGCPVIASNVTSMPEVVGEAGLLCDPTDVQSIAASMCEVIEDLELVGQMRKQGLQRSQSFGWDRTAAQTLDVYRKVARRN